MRAPFPETSPAGGAPPVGTEVRKMSRPEFDRLAEERHWPRGDYDARRGVAEVVAPILRHEWRVGEAHRFVHRLCGERVILTGALRIEWRGSVPEPDSSFCFLPRRDASGAGSEDWPGLEPAPRAVVAPGFEEACGPEDGHAPLPLLVEINRCSSPARAAEKRADTLEMGVQEIWTWRPREDATIYRRGGDGAEETVRESGVLPGVSREDLEELRAEAEWGESGRRCSAIVRRILERVVTDGPRG